MQQQKLDQFMMQIQEEMSNDITLSNSLILYRKGCIAKSHFEAAESFSKAIILLEDSLVRKRVTQGMRKLLELCQQQLNRLNLTPYILNDCHHFHLTETLEQVHHIDHIEDKIFYLIKRWNIILIKGGLITQHIKFHPKIWKQNNEQKNKTYLYKMVVSAIEKLIALYKYTPEAELNHLSEEMKDSLLTIYKEYLNKRTLNEDLLYWLQVFFKSSVGIDLQLILKALIELIQERSGKIDHNTQQFIYKFIQRLSELCLFEILGQIRNKIKKYKQ